MAGTAPPRQRGRELSRGFSWFDAAFSDVIGSTARLIHVIDLNAHEGPVYAGDENALYLTSLPRADASGAPTASVVRLEMDGVPGPVGGERVSIVPADVVTPNGMTMGSDGRLLVCEQGTRSRPAGICRVDRHSGRTTTVVDAWHGLQLNSPNDVVERSDGTIWFTDPSYGSLQGFRPSPEVGDFVYRFDPWTGSLDVVADDLDKPNGLAFSPSEDVLYVTDSGANQRPGSYHVERPHHVLAYDVTGGRNLTGRRLLAVTTPGFPDGITVDVEGRVYVSSPAGVLVLTPEGDLLGRIDVPGAVNFTFGGSGRNVLFITTDAAVVAAVLDTRGA